MDNLEKIPINTLNLSNRTLHILLRNGINDLETLMDLVEGNLLYDLPLVGEKTVDEIIGKLKNFDKTTKIIEVKSVLPEEPLDSIPIRMLDLPRKITNTLLKNRIRTIGDLIRIDPPELYKFNYIGPKTHKEIYDTLNRFKCSENARVGLADQQIEQTKKNTTWASFVQPYFESEKEDRIYVLISRFGLEIKTLEDVASVLEVTRERIRQIQLFSARNFINFNKNLQNNELQLAILDILDNYGKQLSIKSFKSKLNKEKLIGTFSSPMIIRKTIHLDPFETLIVWLSIISNPKFVPYPRALPIEINSLRDAKILSVKNN